MFHIIALVSLLGFMNKATASDVSPNGTEGYFGFYDNLNSTKPQWRCSVVSPDPFILNSSQTLDVRLNCTRIVQGSEILATKKLPTEDGQETSTTEPPTTDGQETTTTEPPTTDGQETTTTEPPTQLVFQRTFLIGASAGMGLAFIVIMIVSILCCCAKRQKTRNLNDRLEDNKPKCAVTDADTLISLNNETTQPLCENDSNAVSNDSTNNDVVVEVEDNMEESDYLTPVDSQTEIKIFIKHENGANQKRNEAPIYARPLSKNSRLLPPLLTPPPANVGEKNGENGAEAPATVPSTESEKNTFQTRNSGKNRYQDLKYPTYENWAHNKGTYMSLLKANDQNDNQSRTRVPSEVAYVNLPKKSSPLLT